MYYAANYRNSCPPRRSGAAGAPIQQLATIQIPAAPQNQEHLPFLIHAFASSSRGPRPIHTRLAREPMRPRISGSEHTIECGQPECPPPIKRLLVRPFPDSRAPSSPGPPCRPRQAAAKQRPSSGQAAAKQRTSSSQAAAKQRSSSGQAAVKQRPTSGHAAAMQRPSSGLAAV